MIIVFTAVHRFRAEPGQAGGPGQLVRTAADNGRARLQCSGGRGEPAALKHYWDTHRAGVAKKKLLTTGSV